MGSIIIFCEYLAEVSHHAGVPFALIVVLHLRNVLVEYFSMLITHCTKVWREEVEVGMKKMNLE